MLGLERGLMPFEYAGAWLWPIRGAGGCSGGASGGRRLPVHGAGITEINFEVPGFAS